MDALQKIDVLQERYVIQKQLGDRYGQKTYLARDRQTETFVVIKLILFTSELKWETVKLFEREANTLKSLHHSAIPRYLDYFDVETGSGKGFALVQSFIAADSLSQHVSKGHRFTETELKDIARDILKVFNYLHSQQPPIIHRDIKPSNLLLSDPPPSDKAESSNRLKTGQLFLVDFGSVQAMQSDGGTRTVVGTYGYMPPEQFGDRAVPASDLYGLGATLIYLASGQHPADLPQKNLRICFEDSVLLSADFVQWLRTMTAPALEKRFSSAQQALDALLHQPNNKASSSLRQKQTHPLPILTKPAGSKVILHKTSNHLEIVVPPKGFTPSLIPTIIFASIWNVFLLGWYSMAFRMGLFGLFPGLFAIGHLYAGIGMIISVLQALFGTTTLFINDQTITVEHQLLGFTRQKPKPADRKDIIRVEQSQATHTTKKGRHTSETVSPQLSIWAGTKQFNIGGNNVLSTIELEWLAGEVSAWLNLPASQ
ncbi:MAG: serine/threonine-protein kinase [Cyanobacteria bacterium J06621_11]